MSHDDLTPERLDALIDGAEPATDAERDVLHMAAALRSASPRPSDDLKRRVRALGEPARPAQARPRRRWNVLAPALGALAAGIIATTVVVTRSPDASTSPASQDAAAPTAQPTGTGIADGTVSTFQGEAGGAASQQSRALPTWFVPPGATADIVAQIEEITAAAGGSIAVTDDDAGKLIAITVDPARRAELSAQIISLVSDRQAKGTAPAASLQPDPSTPLTFRLREAP